MSFGIKEKPAALRGYFRSWFPSGRPSPLVVCAETQRNSARRDVVMIHGFLNFYRGRKWYGYM